MSCTGPEAGRDLVWTLLDVRLLRMHLKAAPPSDRGFLKPVYRERLRTAVYETLRYYAGGGRLLKELM